MALGVKLLLAVVPTATRGLSLASGEMPADGCRPALRCSGRRRCCEEEWEEGSYSKR